MNYLNYLNYLKRIGFEGEAKADLATLSNLQYRHFLSVPYENLDILRNVPLSLETTDLYDKIVVRKRGGYCFELNALFDWLLCEIGFKTKNYFARFLLDEPKIPMRRHRVILVEIEDEIYLSDVGVGSVTPELPLRLVKNEETTIRGLTYMFEKDEFLGWVLNVKRGEKWSQLYSFTADVQLEVDFVQPNFYCQYSPDSVFKKANMVSLRTETGKYTLDANTFRELELFGAAIKTERECTEDEIPGILKQYFGIEL
ncbi:MAG: arylamine N-acetyltransferase [Oscillospiraceae bacterium]|nr:arylamine N-acetyltransferase [Oscillospiraceae bacterium]